MRRTAGLSEGYEVRQGRERGMTAKRSGERRGIRENDEWDWMGGRRCRW